MKTLDALLSRWVGEADDSRADTAFQAYYSTAFPSLARHVQHRTGWDLASAEDIAQEALLRFFERAGRGRREAVALVRSTATDLPASAHDAPHPQRTVRWAGDVSAFAGSVNGFRLSSETQWRTAAADIWSQIVSLQKAGLCLIDEAARNLPWSPDVGRANTADGPPVFPVDVQNTASADLNEREISGLAGRLARAHSLNTSRAAIAEECRPGIGRFAQTVLTIVETLPRLRLPTNSYLFEIATTLFLDEIKRQRRRKRGGVRERVSVAEVGTCGIRDLADHPVELLSNEPQADLGDGIRLDQHLTSEGGSHAAASMLSRDVDPVVRYESEQFLLRFYEYLRAPVARAVRALEEARGTAQAFSEQYRLERVSRKFSRMMTVLSMMGEGYTQEETARRAGMSRNQVKYVLESVKEAYVRFAAEKPRLPRPQVTREGEPRAS